MLENKYNFKKVLKEIFILIFAFVFVYFVFNNNYVRPALKEGNKDWSINKREHKLALGLSGHTFIELQNESGQVIGQIHGFAYDEKTADIVETATKGGYKLKVFVFDYDYYLSRNKEGAKAGISLYKGSASSTKQLWDKAKICGAEIDSKNYDYPRYGFKIINETENSNSVAHSIINCIGLKDKNIGLITPGHNTDLLSD